MFKCHPQKGRSNDDLPVGDDDNDQSNEDANDVAAAVATDVQVSNVVIVNSICQYVSVIQPKSMIPK